MKVEGLEEKLRAFLAKFYKNHDLTNDEDIFALGFFNSLFAMQLIMTIEREFSITVTSKDLDPDNFRSINAIKSFIASKSA